MVAFEILPGIMSNKQDILSGKDELRRRPEEYLRVQPSEVDASSILAEGSKRSRQQAAVINVARDKDGDGYSSGFDSAPLSSNASQAGDEQSDASVQSRESIESAQDGASGLQDTLAHIVGSLKNLAVGHQRLMAAHEATEKKLEAVVSGRIEAQKEPQDISSIISHGLKASPAVSKSEQRRLDVARQLEHSNVPRESQELLMQALGATAAKVNPLPPFSAQHFSPLHKPGTGVPDVFNSVKVLNAVAYNADGGSWYDQLGQQVVNNQAIKKTKDAKNKQLVQALSSYDKLYGYLYQEGMLSGHHFDTYDVLLHQLKQLELCSGWEVAKRYVEYLIDIDNKYKDTRSLQDKVGSRPVDGNFFNTLDSVGLRLCQHAHAAGEASKVEALERNVAELMARLKGKGKGKDSTKKFTPAGSPTKEGKNQYYCKHHKLYFSNPEHTSEKCRLGKSPNASPAPNAAGAGSD